MIHSAPDPRARNKREYDAQPARREKRREYRKSEAGKKAERKYRHDNSKWITDEKYLSQKFVAVDGEGVNTDNGDHIYVLLAISNVQPLFRKEGISTEEALEYLWENLSDKDINVIYGGSYDFNLWLRGVGSIDETIISRTRRVYHSNYTSGFVRFGNYGVRWIRGKGFEIERDNKRVKISDVISFFQCPFIKACDEYLKPEDGWTEENREIIVREKARRGNFSVEEIENIASYNNLELILLEKLVTELRARLNRVSLRPRRWDGPGAIAASLFVREKVKQHRNENIPLPVAKAARFAYAGGRFEMLKYGCVKEKAYEYDINSAYPSAMRNLPSLASGVWLHHERSKALQNATFPFALYRVSYTGTQQNIPGPIFHRAPNGTISYPLSVENWVWSPEMETLREYCKVVEGASFKVLECWEFQEEKHIRPFAFIEPLYNKRQVMKASGDGAHVGIKLALNSMYGKLAQQVGWIPETQNNPVRIPAYHQLEWAGYITSHCRATALRAVMNNLEDVIAFETDAVFTTKKLDIDTGKGLGQWEYTEFESLTYVQSGHYYATSGETEIIKCRGIDRGFISRADVESKLTEIEPERLLAAALTRFYGAGISLVRGLSEYWCKWKTEPKYLFLGPSGKRVHGACWCDPGTLEVGRWHQTFCPIYGGVSSEYPVEWINPATGEMRKNLTENRESENDYESD